MDRKESVLNIEDDDDFEGGEEVNREDPTPPVQPDFEGGQLITNGSTEKRYNRNLTKSVIKDPGMYSTCIAEVIIPSLSQVVENKSAGELTSKRFPCPL